jgi:hypothetical protein
VLIRFLRRAARIARPAVHPADPGVERFDAVRPATVMAVDIFRRPGLR